VAHINFYPMCLADGEEDEGDMEKDLPFIKHSPHVRR
jgi:hypothetical protein